VAQRDSSKQHAWSKVAPLTFHPGVAEHHLGVELGLLSPSILGELTT
jgi:hypothetical protein